MHAASRFGRFFGRSPDKLTLDRARRRPLVAPADATLAPFGGRFVIHGGETEHLEGAWQGDLVVIGFPDRDSARAWYVGDDHRATDILSR